MTYQFVVVAVVAADRILLLLRTVLPAAAAVVADYCCSAPMLNLHQTLCRSVNLLVVIVIAACLCIVSIISTFKGSYKLLIPLSQLLARVVMIIR
jgi:hypothetical protein